MTIPQLRGPFKIIAAIAIVSFSFSMFNGLRHGEARTLANWADICIDAVNYAALAVFGWVALKSPWAKEVTSLLNQEKESTTTEPSGVVTVEKTKTSLETSAPVVEEK